VVAEARSLPALRALARLMSRLAPGGKRVMGTALWPPGLAMQEEHEAARVLARLYEVVFLHGPGAERAAELIRAARPADAAPTVCVPTADETAAMERLMQRIEPGDRVLLLAGTAAATLTLLDSYRPIF
jgi:hypothetical protein